MMHRAVRLLPATGGALLLLCSATAWADRPLVSETADVIGAGDCQIETGLARQSASGTHAARMADVLGSCGVASHTQLGISLGSARQAGATDLSLGLGGKTTLKMPKDGAIGTPWPTASAARSPRAKAGATAAHGCSAWPPRN